MSVCHDRCSCSLVRITIHWLHGHDGELKWKGLYHSQTSILTPAFVWFNHDHTVILSVNALGTRNGVDLKFIVSLSEIKELCRSGLKLFTSVTVSTARYCVWECPPAAPWLVIISFKCMWYKGVKIQSGMQVKTTTQGGKKCQWLNEDLSCNSSWWQVRSFQDCLAYRLAHSGAVLKGWGKACTCTVPATRNTRRQRPRHDQFQAVLRFHRDHYYRSGNNGGSPFHCITRHRLRVNGLHMPSRSIADLCTGFGYDNMIIVTYIVHTIVADLEGGPQWSVNQNGYIIIIMKSMQGYRIRCTRISLLWLEMVTLFVSRRRLQRVHTVNVSLVSAVPYKVAL